ncbi:MAG: NADH-quinone oxidoreductase subunit C [Microthrixaceae bacterium]
MTDEAATTNGGSADVAVEPETLHGALVTRHGGQTVLFCERSELVELVTTLRGEGFWQCVDVCGVDYLTHPGRHDLPPGLEGERFEVVIGLLNHRERTRLRIRVQVPEHDCRVPSLCSVHPGAEAPEREAFDMFGIRFDGHPDMTRILMPDDWDGHPLRKDYDSGRIPVQFTPAATTAR